MVMWLFLWPPMMEDYELRRAKNGAGGPPSDFRLMWMKQGAEWLHLFGSY